MSSFAIVDNAFWTDAQVVDNFTPEDKYFYLYLLTNVHINVSGCFEVSTKQIAQEMGYSIDSVNVLLDRFVNVHKVIDYDKDTKEILIHRWAKYHWNTSDKYLTAVRKKIDVVKSERFSYYLNALLENYIDSCGTVCIPYQYGMDMVSIQHIPYTYIYNSGNDSISKSNEEKKDKKEKKSEPAGAVRSEDDRIEAELVDTALSECSAELIQSVCSWLEYKKEKRQKYTERGRSALLKTIAKKTKEFGDEAVISIIEQSMANGYMGILWDRLERKNYGNAGKRPKAKSYGEMLGEVLGNAGS